MIIEWSDDVLCYKKGMVIKMKKVFVDVTAFFTKEGKLMPVSFIWEDGVIYEIEKVYGWVKAASLKVGGQGIRYKCRVKGKEVYLFLEEGRWFMEGKQGKSGSGS